MHCLSQGKRGKEGQTFLWAKLQCIIMCVLVPLVGQGEWASAVIDDVI